MTCVLMLTAFLFAGSYVFSFFGITVPAFQIMGGIIFLANSLRTLLLDDSNTGEVGGSKRVEDQDVKKAELDPSSIDLIGRTIVKLAADELPEGKGKIAFLSGTATCCCRRPARTATGRSTTC